MSSVSQANATSRGLPKDKREKGGKGKKGKKPVRILYYGVEQRPDRRAAVPIATLTRRLRTATGSGENADVTWSTLPEHRPVLQYDSLSLVDHRHSSERDSLSLIDIGVQRMPPMATEEERAEEFSKHWAFRPKLQHPPFQQSSAEMRPFIERMLERITERQRKERAEREAELARQKAAKKKKGGKKKKAAAAENKSANTNRV